MRTPDTKCPSVPYCYAIRGLYIVLGNIDNANIENELFIKNVCMNIRMFSTYSKEHSVIAYVVMVPFCIMAKIIIQWGYRSFGGSRHLYWFPVNVWLQGMTFERNPDIP